MTSNKPHTIIIGAGPVGLAAASLLAARGHAVTLFEGKDELDLNPTSSYPIGVNPRGQEALRRIDPALLEELRAEGEVIEAFNVYVGTRRISQLKSGSLIATTRAFLTRILLEKARSMPTVEYVPGHKLKSVSVAERTLTFEKSSGEVVDVPAGDARVIAADGTWSATRRSLEQQVDDFTPRMNPWGLKFRVVFSQPGASSPALDPAIHHIFTAKGMYSSTLKDGVWGLAVAAIEGDESEKVLLADEPTDENVRALEAHVQEHAPQAAPLFTRDDYAAYFTRAPFSGAVVISPRIAFDEWLLLVGDAAHGVIPATGEGVNSGLEDAFLLAEHAVSGSLTWFADFEKERLPDIHALGEYAWTLTDNIASDDPARGPANLLLRIGDTVAGKLPVPSAQVEDRLFGPDAGLTPYREAIGPWITQRERLFPAARSVVAGVQSAANAVVGGGSDRKDGTELRWAGMHPVEEPMTLTVIGGSRGSGREVVTAALEAGHAVRVVSRSGTPIDGAMVITGDATDVEVAKEAIAGSDAVIVCVGGAKDKPRARTDVTRSVVEGMREAGVRRLVVQTSLGASDSASQLPAPQRLIAPKMLAKPLEDHTAQEDVVRASGLDWTIVRPSGLNSKPGVGQWRILRQGDPGTVGGRITRRDVANCILDVLGDEAMVGVEFGVGGR